MTDTLFDDCVDVLANIHKDMPDLRFGEVLQNAIDLHLQKRNMSLCDVPTKQLKLALSNYYQKEKHKRGILS